MRFRLRCGLLCLDLCLLLLLLQLLLLLLSLHLFLHDLRDLCFHLRSFLRRHALQLLRGNAELREGRGFHTLRRGFLRVVGQLA